MAKGALKTQRLLSAGLKMKIVFDKSNKEVKVVADDSDQWNNLCADFNADDEGSTSAYDLLAILNGGKPFGGSILHKYRIAEEIFIGKAINDTSTAGYSNKENMALGCFALADAFIKVMEKENEKVSDNSKD